MSGFAFIVLWGTWEAELLLRSLNPSDWWQVIHSAVLTDIPPFEVSHREFSRIIFSKAGSKGGAVLTTN
ncbi:MAG: hypothetical protein ACAF41_28225 [Leptolyngbya sp. BL-A-14]